MPAVRKGPALRLFWKIHRWLLWSTRGRFFTGWVRAANSCSSPKGRKTGEPRPVGLSYIIEPPIVGSLIASNAGEDSNPAWWLNLVADPLAHVIADGQSIPVRADELEEPERGAAFARFVTEVDKSYIEYQARTSRRLPVVALSRLTL